MIGTHSVADVIVAEQSHPVELASGVLMERAATAVALSVVRLLRVERGTTAGSRVAVLAGSGNNGGDALFAGAQLAGRGIRVDAIGEVVHEAGLGALLAAGGRFLQWRDPGVAALLRAADVIVDGVVGIGAHGALRGMGAALAPLVNAAGAAVVAVDLPSGVDADTGLIAGDVIRADRTVTFGAAKSGLVLAPAAEHVGVLEIIDIGIRDALRRPVASVLEDADVAALVPAPGFGDHKYRRGVVGVAAGSARFPGAALLATAGALAGDIGMARVLDRADLARLVIAAHPQVVPGSGVDDGRTDAWVAGPGFPGDDDDALVLEQVLGLDVPLVLDAGALRLLAERAELLGAIAGRHAPTVLTPHEGEFARLGGTIDGRGRLAGARALAERTGAVVLLKGPASVVVAPDGTAYVDAAGSPALATAGSGDLLAGLAAALLAGQQARARLRTPADAARVVAAACWLHGMAGRSAAAGGVAVTASDIAAHLPRAVGRARAARLGQ